MNQHFWCTELGTYHLKSGVELRFIGNIAWIGARKCDLLAPARRAAREYERALQLRTHRVQSDVRPLRRSLDRLQSTTATGLA